MAASRFKTRNPFLVLVWSFGLFILMQTPQYLGIFLASVLSGASLDSIASGEFESDRTILAKGLNSLILGIPVALLTVRYLWRRSFNWMRLEFSARMFIRGAVLGILLPLVVIGVLALFGTVDVTGYPGRLSITALLSILLGVFGAAVCTGVVEEIVFRGMAAREFAARWGWARASLVAGVYFGCVHLLGNIMHLNVASTIWILVGAVLVNGLFVALYMRGSSLWLPVGFHAGWNFTLTAILGTTMSGEGMSWGLLRTELKGPAVLTGGSFGLELSIVALAVYSIATLIALRLAVRGRVSLLSPDPGVESAR